jgi:hypothetical protein
LTAAAKDEDRVTELAIVVAISFSAGYALRAGIAARRRRIFFRR